MAGSAKKQQLYWFCQVFGWSFYIIVNSVFFGLSREPGSRELLVYFLMLPAGIGITHVYRLLLLRLGILKKKIPAQLAFIVVSSFIKAFLFFLAIVSLSSVSGIQFAGLTPVYVVESVLNFTSIFWLWNVIYFGFQYFQNYKLSEINALRYLAASRKSELDNLKAQLNPHFIFNCLNSIRALIDENPPKAKTAVTTLSAILRTTLDTGRHREIPLKVELALVNDYLGLEQIRYEERLEYVVNVADSLMEWQIPPFIIQAQVENAVKHGLSKRPGKCVIRVDLSQQGKDLHIAVCNTGTLLPDHQGTGVGLTNSSQRLRLLYGQNASISISQKDTDVCVDVRIPPAGATESHQTNTPIYESHHH
jgi:two-component system, LytTR family, sensor kinase